MSHEEIRKALANGPTPGPWYTADWSNDFGENKTTIEAQEQECCIPGNPASGRAALPRSVLRKLNMASARWSMPPISRLATPRPLPHCWKTATSWQRLLPPFVLTKGERSMDDRQLLEAAAQAAGMQHKWHADGLLVDERCGVWNPLVDDADAFRLAVKLGISLDRTSNRCWSWRAGEAGLGVCEEFYKDDSYAATRRAIVRAAASLQDPQENRDV